DHGVAIGGRVPGEHVGGKFVHGFDGGVDGFLVIGASDRVEDRDKDHATGIGEACGDAAFIAGIGQIGPTGGGLGDRFGVVEDGEVVLREGDRAVAFDTRPIGGLFEVGDDGRIEGGGDALLGGADADRDVEQGDVDGRVVALER